MQEAEIIDADICREMIVKLMLLTFEADLAAKTHVLERGRTVAWRLEDGVRVILDHHDKYCLDRLRRWRDAVHYVFGTPSNFDWQAEGIGMDPEWLRVGTARRLAELHGEDWRRFCGEGVALGDAA